MVEVSGDELSTRKRVHDVVFGATPGSFLNENKDRSIFRKNIGRVILQKIRESGLWLVNELYKESLSKEELEYISSQFLYWRGTYH